MICNMDVGVGGNDPVYVVCGSRWRHQSREGRNCNVERVGRGQAKIVIEE